MYISFSTIAVSLLLGAQSVTALPRADGNQNGKGNGNGRGRGNGNGQQNAQLAQLLQGTGIRGMSVNQMNALLQNLASAGVKLGCENAQAGNETAAAPPAAAPPAAGGEAGGEAGAGEGEGEGAANEVELAGEFDVAVALGGGDIKQDVLYTKTTVGAFEFEFQSAAADELTVTENKTPAGAPAGFEFLETSSFKVALSQSKGVGLTLAKIDFVFDAAAAGLQDKDVAQSQVGKLCADTGEFVISEALGELEFEVEENEVTLNLNKNVVAEGEWGIFLPVAAATAPAA